MYREVFWVNLIISISISFMLDEEVVDIHFLDDIDSFRWRSHPLVDNEFEAREGGEPYRVTYKR